MPSHRPRLLAALLLTACASAPRSSTPRPLPALSATRASPAPQPPASYPILCPQVCPWDLPLPELPPAPALVDSDGDRVPDDDDRCPAVAETVNGFNDTNGCPDDLPKDLARALRDYPYDNPEMVATARSETPGPRLRSRLREIAAMLRLYPELRLEITWHADSDGKPTYSMAYDQRSAQAVKAHLIDHEGIAADRLIVRHVGPDEPVDTNKTAQGRKHNRRVEFELVAP